jgi:hypothetical protein
LRLDVRFPLGSLFLAIGGILCGYARWGSLETLAARIDARCGIAVVIFGAAALALSLAKRRRADD